MGKTEVFLDNQRAVIAKHLSGAKSYILVAMAYFTDTGLFNMLVKKAEEGIRVQLIVRDDENKTNILSGIDYDKLSELNGYFAYDKKVHHKFCVIDGLTVLSGSYNWTNQASSINHEDLTVITDDMDTAYLYTVRFYEIKKNINPLSMMLSDKINKMSDEEILNSGRPRRSQAQLTEQLKKKLEEAKKRLSNKGNPDGSQPS